MTTTSDIETVAKTEHMERLSENMKKVDALTRRLIDVMTHKTSHNPSLNAPGQDLFARAAQGYWAETVQNPAKILEQQVAYWSKSVLHFAEAQQALAKGRFAAPEDPGPSDPRFANPLWDTHPFFNFVKQQ